MTGITIRDAYEITFKDYPDLVNAKNLCSMLGLCDRKIYELIRSGQISVIPCSKAYRVAKINVIEYLINSGTAA